MHESTPYLHFDLIWCNTICGRSARGDEARTHFTLFPAGLILTICVSQSSFRKWADLDSANQSTRDFHSRPTATRMHVVESNSIQLENYWILYTINCNMVAVNRNNDLLPAIVYVAPHSGMKLQAKLLIGLGLYPRANDAIVECQSGDLSQMFADCATGSIIAGPIIEMTETSGASSGRIRSWLNL